MVSIMVRVSKGEGVKLVQWKPIYTFYGGKVSSEILVQLPPARKSSQRWDEPGHWGCPHHSASAMDCGLTRYYR